MPEPHVGSRVSHPGIHFPPPFIYAGGFMAGLAIERWVMRVHLAPAAARPLFVVGGWLAIVFGLVFAANGIITFIRNRTSLLPMRPARLLVQSGPYRLSRNPMYVGLGGLYIGLACLFNTAWPLALLPLVVLAIDRFVIAREERYLAAAFGEEYEAYCQQVRRWV